MLPANRDVVISEQRHVLAVTIFRGPSLASSAAGLQQVFRGHTWICRQQTCRYAYVSTHMTDGIKTVQQCSAVLYMCARCMEQTEAQREQ